jgi:CheY-like chemotaxis protein
METATNGVEAITKMRVHRPDILISDVMMPEMDAFDILAAIRNDATLHGFAIILMGARPEDQPLNQLPMKHKDFWLIYKPFNPAELTAIIQKILTEQIHEIAP